MGLFGTKLSFGSFKDAVKDTANQVSETVQRVDVKGKTAGVTKTATSIAERTTDATKMAYSASKEKVVRTCVSVSEEVRSFDYSKLCNTEYYREHFDHYKDLSSNKVSEYFRATFEVDKSTMEMVDDVRSRLPVPAKTIEDIFDQCKREAMRRAVAAFALSGVLQNIDNHSKAKYNNLSESYNEFSIRSGNSITDDPNFAAMKDKRYEAKQKILSRLENGYNKAQPLDPFDADIEHVISKKELFNERLLRIGTTDDEFYSLINSPENLVFAESSVNRSMQDMNILDFLAKRGRPDPANPDLVHIDITQLDGTIKTHTVNSQDIKEAYDRAVAKRSEHRVAAAKEVGKTALKTGAAMAAQQVVGLIVIETIDIFVDEIRNFAINGRITDKDGWLKNQMDFTKHLRQRLVDRFEERQIWDRAKSLGIEAAVVGALSVIPQILISFILKMPSFIFALIRECTLSIVRCVRVLASDDVEKLEKFKIILTGAMAAIAGVFIARTISKGIACVPLLNRFNTAITDVLTGLLIMAVPLAAIYAFEQNKNKLTFMSPPIKSGPTWYQLVDPPSEHKHPKIKGWDNALYWPRMVNSEELPAATFGEK